MTEDTDVVYISGTPTSQKMWHFYHDCIDKSKPCSKCVCYVCDCEVSICISWFSHINAIASSKWYRQRRAKRRRGVPPSLPIK